jgi:soluble lytic murein transglycosylase-like protein
MRFIGNLTALYLVVVAAPAAATPEARAALAEAALANNVPVAIVEAVARTESGLRCNAVGTGPSIGVMQVNPRTARSVGVTGDLTDCRTGAEAGVRYLALAMRTRADLCAALSAYNTGISGRARCTAYGRRLLDQLHGSPR